MWRVNLTRQTSGLVASTILTATILVGCSGAFVFPTCGRPLTPEETTHLEALADLIEVAGPRWQGNARTLRTLLEKHRVCVGDVGNDDALATYRPRRSGIILSPRFWRPEIKDVGRAFVLVMETCHIKVEGKGRCHLLALQWEREYLEVIKREPR